MSTQITTSGLTRNTAPRWPCAGTWALTGAAFLCATGILTTEGVPTQGVVHLLVLLAWIVLSALLRRQLVRMERRSTLLHSGARPESGTGSRPRPTRRGLVRDYWIASGAFLTAWLVVLLVPDVPTPVRLALAGVAYGPLLRRVGPSGPR